MDDAKRKAFVVLGVGLLAISWAAILVRLCHAPAMIVAFYRLALSAIILAPWFFFSGTSDYAPRWRRGWGLMVLSGVFLASHFHCWIEAVQRAPVALAVTISSTHPVFVGLLSQLVYGKGFGRARAVGTLVTVGAVAGMMWDPSSWSHGDLYGFLWALGASFFFALYMMIGQRVRTRTGIISYVVPVYGVAASLLMAGAIFRGLDFLGYSPQTIAMFILLALVPTVIGHSSLNWALGHLSATMVAVSVLAEPVGASLLAWAILGERLRGSVIFWGSIILFGIYISSREEIWERGSRRGRVHEGI
jgi:drug/metabolite transporter (DMT)-like permease